MSLPWLCGFIAELYDRLPDDLGVRPVAASRRLEVLRLEADELWSFVRSKANKQWISPGLGSGN